MTRGGTITSVYYEKLHKYVIFTLRCLCTVQCCIVQKNIFCSNIISCLHCVIGKGDIHPETVSSSEYGLMHCICFFLQDSFLIGHIYRKMDQCNWWCDICILSCPRIPWWLYRVLSVSTQPCLNVPPYDTNMYTYMYMYVYILLSIECIWPSV